MAERLGNPARVAGSKLAIAELLLNLGRHTQATPILEEAAHTLAQDVRGNAVMELWHELLSVRAALGRHEVAGLKERIEALRQKNADLEHPVFSLWLTAMAMELALLEGRPGDACRLAQVDSEARDPLEAVARRRIHALAAHAHASLARRRSPGTAVPLPASEETASTGAQEDVPSSLEAEAVDPTREERRSPDSPASQGVTNPGPRLSSVDNNPPLTNESGTRRGSGRPPDVTASSGTGEAGAPREASGAGPSDAAYHALWLDRIRSLLEVADQENALAHGLARLAGELLDARGLVLIWDGDTIQAINGPTMSPEEVEDINTLVVERVRKNRAPYISKDIRVDPDLGLAYSLREADVKSLVCWPVLHDDTCIGAIYVDHRVPGAISGDRAVSVVERVAALASDLLAAIQRRRASRFVEAGPFGLIGDSPSMRRLRARIQALARSESDDLVVLFLGETGTGKSFIARALHQAGTRSRHPFVTMNCGSVSPSLFEAEVFGHAKGAFTGAVRESDGHFGAARAGTLFLDEIGDLALEHQQKLLTALSDREYSRVGEPGTVRKLDIHLYCATNRDLGKEAAEGRFRQDFLRRIFHNVVHIPPLRERGEQDIRALANHFLSRCLPAGKTGVPVEAAFTRSALTLLYTYEWPWNVGELESVFRDEEIRQRIRADSGEKIDRGSLEEVLAKGRGDLEAHSPYRLPRTGMTLDALEAWYKDLKRTYVENEIHLAGDNVAEAARQMSCSRATLYDILRGGRPPKQGTGKRRRRR